MRQQKGQLSKRKIRIRAKLKRLSDRLRLSVFRSNKYIYGQIIDDQTNKVLVAVSDQQLKKIKDSDKPLTKTTKAKTIGKLLAEKAKKQKITKVFFDRGGNRYHGRIKALAEGAREGGLEF